ncbi:helix-turn-helix domain-containing protein [Sedimentitalea todarodis]|uniref:Cupin domain-containing protein n=1 Tax=Sedimentitalea todarodis TaxID=1631240 RepID=A0ABU3VDZ6_9RHOB|nr:cupin domain-containing protein [Sedimentitalea todarodis]MDU9004400.1 cupin domain-containing protein [Sedimentitalea todarodis]
MNERHQTESQTTTRDTRAAVGDKLRHARRKQNLTLKAVADRVGCSESMLSKIERGRVAPGLDLLARLAESLNASVAALFSEAENMGVVVYQNGERPTIEVGGGQDDVEPTVLQRLVPLAKGRLLNGNVHVVPPGGGSSGALIHQGEEVGFVVDGFIELTVDGKVSLLGAGASFYFSSTLPHSYRNIGTDVARIVWINSPPY